MADPQSFQVFRHLTPVATWLHLALYTCLAVLVVHLSTRLFRFVLGQVQTRGVMKQFSTPPKHWLFGHNRKASRNQEGFQIMLEWMKKYSSHFIPLWVGPFNVFPQCVHPELIKTILGTAEPKGRIYRFLHPWLGDGLLTSHGSKWHRNRRLLTPAFHFEILKPYVTLFSESTNVLIDKWSSVPEGSPVELFDHVSLLTLDSMLKCSLGYRSNCQTDGQSAPYIQAVFELSRLVVERVRFFPFHFDFIYYLSPSGRRFRQQCDIVHGVSEHLIQQRKKALQDGEGKSGEDETGKNRKYLDFLDILLQAKDEDGTGLTDAEIRDEVDTFLFEGHDTTASGISWTLYHLAKHLQYQDRCRREVGALLHGRTTMTWEDMSQLPFTTMCIKESLRIRPPVPTVSRCLTKPLTFPDGKTMPEGSHLTAGIIYSHHNHLIWPDPQVYDPLRFSPERSKDRHHHAFVPFSAGPRNCIGQNFAMNEMKVAVALILQRFRLELDQTKPEPFFVQQLILRAKDGIWIKLTPIS
ncbi:PREDICTED: phylloquinone omega-hydroxylase CYP4F2-like [Branchiostoma belcheri]|uniref:Phylloquinone omega-hydroxylase CYP4F2-like n=1 Tax=Branchiostoma belcheri TaxID=7741 RepID=A0A6P5AEU9_BRABE|nr:PREDICTED: phylloquinone omega-hydroxylase CYP4F2-like [Branchiostoma belcheri]